MYSFVPVSTNPSLPCAPYVVAQAPVQTNPMVYSPHQALQNTGCGTVYMSSQPSQVGAVSVSLWNHPVNNIGQGTVQPQPYMQQMIAPHLSSNYPATQQQQVQYIQLVPASNASQQTFMIVPPNQSFPLNQFVDQSYQQHDALANKTLHASFARLSDPNAQNTLNLDSKNLLSSSAPADEQPSHPAQHHANGTGNVSKKVIRPPSTTWGVMLLDPVNKVNPILNVHFDFISPTEATQSYQEDANNGAANYRMHHKVCPRFTGETTHGNGCSMGQHCRYMHIHPTFLSATRSLTQPLCCAEHNCYFTRYALQTAEKMIQQAKKESEETTSMILPSTVITVWSRGICVGTIQPSKLSLTMACRRLETFPHIDLDRAACRLYQQGRCRWGKECAHVHLCRELYAQWVNSKVFHPAMHVLPPLVQIEAHAEKEICKQGNFDDIASELIMSSCTPVTITPRRSPLSGLLEINEVTADRVAPTHPLLEELTAAAHSDTRTAPDNVIENQTWKTPSDDNTETHVKNDALSNLSSALFSSSHAAQMECDDHLSETDAHSRLISSFSAFCT